ISLLVQNNSNSFDLGWFAVMLAILACGAIGCLSGTIYVGLRIPSFMVTLGMWFIGVGIATLVLGGSTVRVLDKGIRSLALDRPLGLFPIAVWVALGALAITWIIERQTRIGRYIYAIGGGEDLAA